MTAVAGRYLTSFISLAPTGDYIVYGWTSEEGAISLRQAAYSSVPTPGPLTAEERVISEANLVIRVEVRQLNPLLPLVTELLCKQSHFLLVLVVFSLLFCMFLSLSFSLCFVCSVFIHLFHCVGVVLFLLCVQ